MLRITFKSLLARKLRLLLTASSVVLGVAFVAGTLMLGDTLNKTFDNLFVTAYSGTDVGVRGKAAFDVSVTDGGDPAQSRPPVPASELAQIKAVDGVKEAEGDSSGFAQIVRPDGKVIDTSGAPTLGGTWLGDTPLNPYRLKTGKAPTAAGQVAIDAATADDNNIKVGDHISVLTQAGKGNATVTGIVTFGESGSLAGATVTLFDPGTAQQVLGSPGTYSEILVVGNGSVSDAALRARIAKTLPSTLEALTGQQLADKDSGDIKDALSFFSTFLLVFAVIAVFVGSFIIFNTFSMLVAQRSRELALLRALGASRRQVNRCRHRRGRGGRCHRFDDRAGPRCPAVHRAGESGRPVHRGPAVLGPRVPGQHGPLGLSDRRDRHRCGGRGTGAQGDEDPARRGDA